MAVFRLRDRARPQVSMIQVLMLQYYSTRYKYIKKCSRSVIGSLVIGTCTLSRCRMTGGRYHKILKLSTINYKQFFCKLMERVHCIFQFHDISTRCYWIHVVRVNAAVQHDGQARVNKHHTTMVNGRKWLMKWRKENVGWSTTLCLGHYSSVLN